MRQGSFLGLSAAGFHQVAYDDWGDPSGAPVVCVHGLTRNSRDFDRLAARLADDGDRVICPDIVGRGRSVWLPRAELYGYPQYVADMVSLIARLDRPTVNWVGTSMGGLIGMMLAAQPNTPIERLVLNDVGPFVTEAALQRIVDYVGTDPSFPDIAALEQVLRERYPGLGPLTDADWRQLAENSARPKPDGSIGLAYDPAIGAALRAGPIADVDLWPIWEAIRCPVLVLHGADSDVLNAETAAQMARRGPKAEVIDLPGFGHAPALLSDREIGPIRDFLHA